VTDRLLRAHRGLRSTNTRDAFEALSTIVLQHKVTWNEAAMTWRRICEELGEPAPGPAGMRLPPTPSAIRSAGATRLQEMGIGLQRARTLMEVARAARHVREAVDLPTPEATERLLRVRGVGPWSAASLLGARSGRPEPVPLGDFHLPHTIAWALAREPRGTDERLLELLAPFEGHAFRVIRLVFAAKIRAPRRGPKRPLGMSARRRYQG
jgi:3-methyladenine DNA glycosylase/8-oxoguanine DNA glycosylase